MCVEGKKAVDSSRLHSSSLQFPLPAPMGHRGERVNLKGGIMSMMTIGFRKWGCEERG